MTWPSRLRIGLFFLLGAVTLAALAPIAKGNTGAQGEALVGALTAAAMLALNELFRRWERLPLAEVGLAPDRRTPLRFAAGLAGGLTIAALWAAACTLIGPMQWQRSPGLELSGVTLQVAAYLLLAMREELAFHGYPLFRLQRALGTWPALLIVGLLFALEHRLGGMTWLQALLGAGTGSMLFGAAALASRGLALPIGLHAAWNIGHWALGMKAKPGLWSLTVEPGQEMHAEIVAMGSYLVLFILAAALLLRMAPRHQHP